MSLRRACLFSLCVMFGAADMVAQQQQRPRVPRRILYLLAGQSNIERLADPAPNHSTATSRFNVVYHGLLGERGGNKPLQLSVPVRYVPTLPIMDLGARLGQHHANDEVVVALVARSGSAMLMRNANIMLPQEAWIDPDQPDNPAALLNRMDPALQQLAQRRIDELHIVWGQGETDIMAPSMSIPMTTADEYIAAAHDVFAALATMLRVRTYEVELVTLGAILAPWQSNVAADEVREAFCLLEQVPSKHDMPWARIRGIAHHYDLTHPVWGSGIVDAHHLDELGYVQLANRLADGITAPQSLPRIVGNPVVQGTRAVVGISVPLAPFALTATHNQFFALEVDGAAVTNFQIEVAGSTLAVEASAFTGASSVCLRFVTGSGFGASWTQNPLATTAGKPLAPFVLEW